MPVAPLAEGDILPVVIEDAHLLRSAMGERVGFVFRVTDPGAPWDAHHLAGDTPTTFSDHPMCRLHAWVTEIFGGLPLGKGFVLDLEDLRDRPCRVVVGVESGRRGAHNFVKDVIRPRAAQEMVNRLPGAMDDLQQTALDLMRRLNQDRP